MEREQRMRVKLREITSDGAQERGRMRGRENSREGVCIRELEIDLKSLRKRNLTRRDSG